MIKYTGVKRPNPDQVSDIISAVDRSDRRLIILLMERQADVNVQNEDGQTPLFKASQKGYVDIARLLVETFRANINSGDNCHTTPLWIAAYMGNLAMVRYLLTNGANVELDRTSSTGVSGQTPLYIAVKQNHLAVAKLLLEVEVAGRSVAVGRSLMLLAAKHSDLNMFQFLRSHLEVDKEPHMYARMARAAAQQNNWDVLKHLIEDMHVDINMVLHCAVSHGSAVLVGRLIRDYNADVNSVATAPHATSPLLLAAQLKQLELVSLMTELRATKIRQLPALLSIPGISSAMQLGSNARWRSRLRSALRRYLKLKVVDVQRIVVEYCLPVDMEESETWIWCDVPRT